MLWSVSPPILRRMREYIASGVVILTMIAVWREHTAIIRHMLEHSCLCRGYSKDKCCKAQADDDCRPQSWVLFALASLFSPWVQYGVSILRLHFEGMLLRLTLIFQSQVLYSVSTQRFCLYVWLLQSRVYDVSPQWFYGMLQEWVFSSML